MLSPFSECTLGDRCHIDRVPPDDVEMRLGYGKASLDRAVRGCREYRAGAFVKCHEAGDKMWTFVTAHDDADRETEAA
jgi:hypothetical protein